MADQGYREEKNNLRIHMLSEEIYQQLLLSSYILSNEFYFVKNDSREDKKVYLGQLKIAGFDDGGTGGGSSSATFTFWDSYTTPPKPKCIVYFDACGGIVTPEYKTVKYGLAIGDLPTPTKTGKTFSNWVDEHGAIVTSQTIVTSSMNLSAIYDGETVEITYDTGYEQE